MDFLSLNILIAVSLFLLGYFLGSIPSGVMIGRIFFHKDPRNYGSHNSGGTNSGRIFGKKIGVLVIALDILKAVLAFWISWAIISFTYLSDDGVLFMNGELYYWLAGFGAVIGHCWSIFLKFQGGKAVSCFMGIVGGTSWLGLIACLIAFFTPFLKKKIVSYSSLLSGLALVVFEWIMCIVVKTSGNDCLFLTWVFNLEPGGAFFGYCAASVTTITYLIMVYRHRQNISRLKNGTEKPVEWPSKYQG